MAVLVTTIKRYQGLNADDKPTDAPAGSTFYEIDTGDWFVWDSEGEAWVEYTFPLLDATSPELPTTDEKAALNAANSPDASNPFATMADFDAPTIPNLSTPAETGAGVTIADGVLTVTQTVVIPLPESGNSDTIDSISKAGVVAGDLLLLHVPATNTITVDDANINLAAASRAIAPGGSLLLVYDGSQWSEVCFTAATDNV